MPRELTQPPLVRPGDRVAVLSPAWAAPQHFPAVHEQAMQRIRDRLGLEPVEFPTTRRQGTPQERAADLNAAFADESIRAIFATIGGDDQITMLRHLDPALPQRDPKPYCGYSDNTNLLNWLWFHGVAGVHGGSTQVHLGPGPRIDDGHLESLRAALFGGEVELRAVERSRDVGIPWDDPRALTDEPDDQPAEPWTWSGPAGSVTGPTWGGNLEILHWNLAAGRWILPNEAYAGCVLVLETSEELPPPEEVYRMLRNLGERGLLEVFPALVWGRPMASNLELVRSAEEATALRGQHRESVLRAVAEYNPDMVVVMDVDLGHTSPQYVLPYGGRLTVDGAQQRIVAHFGS
jgi:muramoyltetrapeptide carboxypeptidase LdcA involved in peptidoglycan recycling